MIQVGAIRHVRLYLRERVFDATLGQSGYECKCGRELGFNPLSGQFCKCGARIEEVIRWTPRDLRDVSKRATISDTARRQNR